MQHLVKQFKQEQGIDLSKDPMALGRLREVQSKVTSFQALLGAAKAAAAPLAAERAALVAPEPMVDLVLEEVVE